MSCKFFVQCNLFELEMTENRRKKFWKKKSLLFEKKIFFKIYDQFQAKNVSCCNVLQYTRNNKRYTSVKFRVTMRAWALMHEQFHNLSSWPIFMSKLTSLKISRSHDRTRLEDLAISGSHLTLRSSRHEAILNSEIYPSRGHTRL